MNENILELKNIKKSFGGVLALDNVSMSIKKAEIHCLVGENGSGKSTLIKITSGVIRPDQGEIIINGNIYRYLNTISAIKEGVQVIYQDLSLYPNLSVAENIMINQIVEEKLKFISWSSIKNNARKLLMGIGKVLDIDQKVRDLSLADKQIVAICRALTHNANLLIMDEPTSVLTKSEIDALFSIVLQLKEKGISILFVSHKLDEVFKIAEQITILRDGKKIGDYRKDELDNDRLILYITGKKIAYSSFEYKGKRQESNLLLDVRNFSKKGNFENINCKLWPGEILGITGLLGSGRTEFALALFGLNKADTGKIYINGNEVKINSTQDAINLGISYLPEDRLTQGLILRKSISENIIIASLKKVLNNLGLISNVKKEKLTKKWVEQLDVKTLSFNLPVSSLSGGNQQRTVLAKWLATNPKILILDGPTIGIDVASKNNIYSIIRSLAEEGMGIIIISDEIPELLQNCSRIMVMKKGRVIQIFNDPSKITENELNDIILDD